MAVLCERCGKQYDITLFQFGQTLKCDCGNVIDLKKYYPPAKEGKDEK